MFDIAVMHPGMTFWCNVDWLKYYHKLQAQSETKLENPFVSRKVSVKDYRDIYKKGDKAILLRTLNHIIKEVQEVESSKAVQEEMMSATGEAAVTNSVNLPSTYMLKNKRDPVTGRFIKSNKDEDNNKEE